MNVIGAITIVLVVWYLLHRLVIYNTARVKLSKESISYMNILRDDDPSERSEMDRE